MDQIIVLYSFFGPFLVWAFEFLFPYPYIVEELFKSILVYLFPQKKLMTYVYCGIAFAVTETIFYSINIYSYGSLGLLITRLILTSLLHSITFLIIGLSIKKDKRFIALGFVSAVLIHFLYNRFIPLLNIL